MRTASRLDRLLGLLAVSLDYGASLVILLSLRRGLRSLPQIQQLVLHQLVHVLFQAVAELAHLLLHGLELEDVVEARPFRRILLQQ